MRGGATTMKMRKGPEGVHLFDRRSGLNILLDEHVPPAREWSAAPRYVSIALTNACNLRCSYCYAPKSAARLDADEVLAWAVELDGAGCLGIGFGGGEPTLFRGFASLCSAVATSTSLAVTFTTHGHRLDRSLAKELAGSVHFVRVSMDGVGPTYERLRGLSFGELGQRLAVARELAPFGINYVVNADTIDDLDAAVDLAFERGASEFLLLPEVATAGCGGIDDATFARLNGWVAAHHHEYRLALSERGSERMHAPLLRWADDRDPLASFAHIDASGTLKTCAFDRDGVRVEDHGGVLASLNALRSISKETTA